MGDGLPAPMRPPVPDIYVCVRPTIDWQDEAAVEAQLFPEFRPKRAVWDATLSIPYHFFRHRLMEIAEQNLARIRDVTVAPIEQVPEGAIVVPVDDDDWFAPDLASHLAEAYDPAIRGYADVAPDHPHAPDVQRNVSPRSPLGVGDHHDSRPHVKVVGLLRIEAHRGDLRRSAPRRPRESDQSVVNLIEQRTPQRLLSDGPQ